VTGWFTGRDRLLNSSDRLVYRWPAALHKRPLHL